MGGVIPPQHRSADQRMGGGLTPPSARARARGGSSPQLHAAGGVADPGGVNPRVMLFVTEWVFSRQSGTFHDHKSLFLRILEQTGTFHDQESWVLIF